MHVSVNKAAFLTNININLLVLSLFKRRLLFHSVIPEQKELSHSRRRKRRYFSEMVTAVRSEALRCVLFAVVCGAEVTNSLHPSAPAPASRGYFGLF